VAIYSFPKGVGCPTEPWSYCAHHDFPPDTPNPPLPDVLFENVPYLCPLWGVFPSFFLIGFMLFTLFGLMLFNSQGSQILIRFMILDAFLLFLRSLTISTTQMNDPNAACRNCGSVCPDSIWLGIKQVILYPYPLGTCGDCMFSGHTVHYLLMALCWQRYSTNTFKKFLIWLVCLYGLFSLVSCRYHYTIDILVAAIFTFSFWGYYHLLIENLPSLDDVNAKPIGMITRCIIWIETGRYK